MVQSDRAGEHGQHQHQAAAKHQRPFQLVESHLGQRFEQHHHHLFHSVVSESCLESSPTDYREVPDYALMPLESMRMAGRRAPLLGMGILAAILILGRTPGPSPSFRQGPPESRHRDVNQPDQASITPHGWLMAGILGPSGAGVGAPARREAMAPDHVQQLDDLHGLRQKVIDPGRQGGLVLLGQGPGGEGNDRQARQSRFLADFTGSGQAIHDWHLDVHQDDIEGPGIGPEYSQGRFALGRQRVQHARQFLGDVAATNGHPTNGHAASVTRAP